jgi:dihydroxy-acid dehydratase
MDAIEALKKVDIKPGQVVVLRGFGLKGGPGMAGGASGFVFALDGAGLSDQVAMVTDGHLSGLVNRSLVVCEISPEAAEGGPLALVENGDIITIDVERREANLEVPADVLNARRERWVPPETQTAPSGWLQIYRRLVRPLPDGAVLID